MCFSHLDTGQLFFQPYCTFMLSLKSRTFGLVPKVSARRTTIFSFFCLVYDLQFCKLHLESKMCIVFQKRGNINEAFFLKDFVLFSLPEKVVYYYINFGIINLHSIMYVNITFMMVCIMSCDNSQSSIISMLQVRPKTANLV